jgi:hypothetical protein
MLFSVSEQHDSPGDCESPEPGESTPPVDEFDELAEFGVKVIPTPAERAATAARIEALDSLDLAFTLPDNIADPNLRQLYEILVVRMRRESAHLPMNTVQQLLIERIAYNYIVMRSKEAARSPQQGGFQHATQQKEYNTFWLSMTQEFNKQLKTVDSDFRAQIMKAMAAAVADVLRDIDDPILQSRLRMRIADALEREGL